ncbi:MAG TPA: hypothetical protein VMC05_09855 [Xanthobacteraceae bacterium]|nr:hypothetical protein [Xanthobacteraceae bacterium]
MALPLPLRWWYRWAGRRREVMSRQNILFIPRGCLRNDPSLADPSLADPSLADPSLAVKDGRLHFYIENQGVYQWATLPGGDDPPVFGRYARRGRWARENTTLSQHLILTCLFEAVMCHGKYNASIAWLEEEKFAEIVRQVPPLAIPPWRWLDTRFFVKNGVFMLAAENGVGKPYGGKRARSGEKRYYSVQVAAKTEAPLQFLKPLVGDNWDYVTF